MLLQLASKAWAGYRENDEKPRGAQRAAELEAQARESGVARGNGVHEADMEALPIAWVTAGRLGDS